MVTTQHIIFFLCSQLNSERGRLLQPQEGKHLFIFSHTRLVVQHTRMKKKKKSTKENVAKKKRYSRNLACTTTAGETKSRPSNGTAAALQRYCQR